MGADPQPPADDLDRLLDRALQSLGQAEPPPGAADRWLARLRFSVPEPRLGWRRMAIAFAAGIIVAGVAVLSGYARMPRARQPAASLQKASLTPSRPAVLAAPVPASAVQPAPRRVALSAAAPAPTLPFPLPSPATEQEKLVVRLLQAGGSSFVLAESPPVMLAPVDNPPIQIAPLMVPATAVKALATAEDGNNDD